MDGIERKIMAVWNGIYGLSDKQCDGVTAERTIMRAEM
jgi:hypothetical protein